MKIKKTFSRRTLLSMGDSFVTSAEAEFQVDGVDIDRAKEISGEIREMLMSEARKDIKAFFDEVPKKQGEK